MKRRLLASFLVLALAASAVAPSLAEEAVGSDAPAATTTIAQALDAYRAAQDVSVAAERPAAFARAERLFAAAAASETGASAALWTNVGTAALQAEHVGAAILAYRRALALDPDHRQARQNLAHARTLLPGWVPRPDEGGLFDSLLAWRHAMSPAERRGAAAFAFAAGAALAGIAVATGSTALRALAALPLASWLLLLVSSWSGDGSAAGVVATETVARAADSRNAPVRFAEPLPAGAEVAIAEVRGEWTRVVLADGRDAWVASAAVEAVDAAPDR